MSASLPVHFRYYTPKITALHNKITTVHVDEGDTLAYAVALFKKANNITAGTPFTLFFDNRMIDVYTWPRLNIILGPRGPIIQQGTFDADPISINNPIKIVPQMRHPRAD